MERNIIGDLLILKLLNIKPNFSELARIYDMDRHMSLGEPFDCTLSWFINCKLLDPSTAV